MLAPPTFSSWIVWLWGCPVENYIANWLCTINIKSLKPKQSLVVLPLSHRVFVLRARVYRMTICLVKLTLAVCVYWTLRELRRDLVRACWEVFVGKEERGWMNKTNIQYIEYQRTLLMRAFLACAHFSVTSSVIFFLRTLGPANIILNSRMRIMIFSCARKPSWTAMWVNRVSPASLCNNESYRWVWVGQRIYPVHDVLFLAPGGKGRNARHIKMSTKRTRWTFSLSLEAHKASKVCFYFIF